MNPWIDGAPTKDGKYLVEAKGSEYVMIQDEGIWHHADMRPAAITDRDIMSHRPYPEPSDQGNPMTITMTPGCPTEDGLYLVKIAHGLYHLVRRRVGGEWRNEDGNKISLPLRDNEIESYCRLDSPAPPEPEREEAKKLEPMKWPVVYRLTHSRYGYGAFGFHIGPDVFLHVHGNDRVTAHDMEDIQGQFTILETIDLNQPTPAPADAEVERLRADLEWASCKSRENAEHAKDLKSRLAKAEGEVERLSGENKGLREDHRLREHLIRCTARSLQQLGSALAIESPKPLAAPDIHPDEP